MTRITHDTDNHQSVFHSPVGTLLSKIKTMKTNFTLKNLFRNFFWSSTLIISSHGLMAQTGGALFEVGPEMMRTKAYPMSSVLTNGNVISFGGREVGFVSSSFSDMYDPSNNSFSESEMNAPHDMESVVKLSDGRYFIIGGCYDLGIPAYSNTEFYDQSTNSFETASSLNIARMMSAACELNNGNVLVAGAWYDDVGATNGEYYDMQNDTFIATGALNTPRANPILFPTTDGGAIMAGGWPSYGGPNFTSVEYYNSTTNQFEMVSSQLIPADSGWEFVSILTRPIEDSRMTNGNYLLLAYRGNIVTEYALLSFDPTTKLFSKLDIAVPLKDSLTDGGFFDVVLNKTDNLAYLVGVDSASAPQRLSIVTVDLNTNAIYHPTDGFNLQDQEYMRPTLTFVPSVGKILLQGISSTPDNYGATNKTYLITPDITVGNLKIDDSSELTCYPNPVQNQLLIKFSQSGTNPVSLYMIDMLGRKLLSGNYTVNDNNTIQVPTSNIPNGWYTLQINSGRKLYNERIIVSHN